MNLVLQCKKKFKGVEMTQSKLTPDELAMLDIKALAVCRAYQNRFIAKSRAS